MVTLVRRALKIAFYLLLSVCVGRTLGSPEIWMNYSVAQWIGHHGGPDIKGSVDVQDHERSIEIIGMSHGINLPVDSANGKIKGTR